MNRFYISKAGKRLLTILLLIFVLFTVLYLRFFSCAPIGIEPQIRLYLHQQNETVILNVENYICGVVAAEMPAAFSPEALKAQAVCARTYTFKKILDNHDYPLNGDLSDDPNTCQAYINWEEFQKRHPKNYQLLREKIEDAVCATRGEYMIYDGKPIDALYHSTCGGKTESAGDVWMREVPYLKSVPCSYCQNSSYYQTIQVFSYESLQKIGVIEDDLRIEITDCSASGRIKTLKINGSAISAAKFRSLLNLPSTCWTFDIQPTELIINSRGYGHGVGLCQYGANGMAQQGKSYKDILFYYYTDIDLKKVEY